MSSSYRNAVAGVVAALLGLEAGAANWELEPRIQLGAIYDDNYRLTDVPGAEIEVTGALLDAALTLRSEDPRTVLEFEPRIRSTRFPGEEQEESNDWFLASTWSRRGQRLETDVEANYSRENVLTSEVLSAEFPDVDLGDVVAGDAGRVQVRNRRHLLSVRPGLSFRWTQRHRLDAGLGYIDASFDRNLVQQTGFRDLGAYTGISIGTSQRDTLSARLKGGLYEPDSAREDTVRYGVEGEWSRRWSQITKVYARVGVDSTETDVFRRATPTSPLLPVAITETSVVGGLGVQWNFQITEVVLDLVRSTSPSSAGVVMLRDEIRGRIRRELRPRLAAFANVRMIRTEGAVEEVAAVSNRDYHTARAGFEWRMTRQLQVLGAYDYAWQEFEDEAFDATSNAVTLSLVYEPRRRD